MKKTNLVLLIFAIFSLLFFLGKRKNKVKKNENSKDKKEPTRPQQVIINKGGSRAEINNNPGNIRLTSINWLGKIPNSKNTDGSFEQFENITYGIRALVLNLYNYFKNGYNTINKIIDKYAPASDQKSKSNANYKKFMVEKTGFGPDEVINLNKENLIKLARFISWFEAGKDILSNDQINKSIALLPENVKNSLT